MQNGPGSAQGAVFGDGEPPVIIHKHGKALKLRVLVQFVGVPLIQFGGEGDRVAQVRAVDHGKIHRRVDGDGLRGSGCALRHGR